METLAPIRPDVAPVKTGDFHTFAQLVDALASKEDQALASMSREEILKKIEELEVS